MTHRYLSLLLAISGLAVADDHIIDRSGSWDVDAPLGPSQPLTFTTDEGTWMNLDVSPDGNTIVFDLLGDLYLLPVAGGEARRLTSGAAYDIQPRFSPDGSRLSFTSDRGGVNTVWIAQLEGGELGETRKLVDDKSHAYGGASWDADGDWLFVRKRVTDTSSIGISELWMYHRDGGGGIKLVGNGGEVESFSASDDGRYVYYGASGPFSYDRNPHQGIWSVQRYDRRTAESRPVSQGAGSSASPRLGPDGSRLAFVRRVGTRSTLWVHEFATGAERQLWDGLDRDQTEAFGTHNVYPGFDWTPDGRALIVWAQGGFWRIGVEDGSASRIAFRADVEQRWHEPLRSARDPAPATVRARLLRWPVISPDARTLAFNALGHVYWMRLPDGAPQRVTRLDDFEFAPQFSPDGTTLLFTTWNDEDGGSLVSVDWRRGTPGRQRVLHRSPTQLVNPAFSADGRRIVFVAGSGANLRGQDLGSEQHHELFLIDADGGNLQFVVAAANRGSQRRITRPTFSADGRRIWYFDDAGGGGERGARTPPKTALTSVALDGTDKRVHMQFRYAQEAVVSPDDRLVAFTELHNAYVTAVPRAGAPVDFDPNSAAIAWQQLSRDGGEWVNWSADGKYLGYAFANEVHRVPVSTLKLVPKQESPADAEAGVLVLAVAIDDAGRYAYGDESLALDGLQAKLQSAWADAASARVDITLAAATPWQAYEALSDWLAEVKVAVKRIDGKDDDNEAPDAEPAAAAERYVVDLEVPRAVPDGKVAFTGARLITMNGDEVIDNGTIVVDGNRIVAVGPAADTGIPADARRFDVAGKTIMPGLIDVHAHMGYGVLDINPQKEWRYYANLAYGVTTSHDPSASTHTVFSQAEMVDAGLMVGPRIFSTGFILYGAIIPDMAVINSYADALAHVRRLKKLGAFSVKSYMQPRREQRQWVVRAARAENMLVMPEGGGDFPANMGMLLDGHSGIEHALSIGDIYKDVVTLFAETRAAYTATLLVSYGGQPGENWFYQHNNVWENEKLQSFFPPRQIDARARRRSMSADDDYNHVRVARGQKLIDDAGGLITLGAHGQLQGLGAHWELWAIAQGGMATHAALRAATLNGAEYLGMDAHLGSLEAGKLADFIVLDRNPLDDIRNTESVRTTVVDGVVYDADTMNRLWPEERSRGRFYFEN